MTDRYPRMIRLEGTAAEPTAFESQIDSDGVLHVSERTFQAIFDGSLAGGEILRRAHMDELDYQAAHPD